jgi:hypothetical protein
MDVAVEWRATTDSTDLTGVTFSLKFAQDKTYTQAKMQFFIGDGTNTKSFPLSVNLANVWNTFEFSEESMSVTADDDTVTAPTMTAITKIGFRCVDVQPASFGYADSITYQSEPGSFDLELWDLGTSLPDSDGTVDYRNFDQYTEIGDRGIQGFVVSTLRVPLLGGKKFYHIDEFVAGTAPEIPTNTLLTKDRYYSIVIKYVDTDISVFGPDTTFETKYYSNGYGWTAATADGLIDILPGANGAGAYSDIMFQIFSTQDIYVRKATMLADNAPNGEASVSVYCEDENMNIVGVVATEQKGGFGRTEIVFDRTDQPSFLHKGGKFEAYYNDDPTDDVSEISFIMEYFYKEEPTNG